MSSGRIDLYDRTKGFAVRIVRLSLALTKNEGTRVIGRQILRSGTSVGAQLREGKRSRSKAELISKTESALQELEETVYWMELLVEAGLCSAERLEGLMSEADQLISILVASVKTMKRKS